MGKVVSSEPIMAAVKEEAVKVDAHMREDIARMAPTLDDLLLEVLEYGLFNGGKRVRPLLVVLGARLCGKDDNGAYRLGCAFEYLHAATLFHDDIIDNSTTRRGNQSVFKKFGMIEAILAGDFLHAHSMATVGKFAGPRGLDIFCRATTGMVDGEFMQLRNAEKYSLSELDYYDAIMGKTGLLIAAACEVGAVYGGGDEEEVKALKEYGVNLGCAFQIVDDLLDYLGDTGQTGKAIGNDLAEGKITLPLIVTINEAVDNDKARLMEILADKQLRSHSFAEVSSLVLEYGGFEAARKRASDAVEKASRVLEIFTDEKVLYERTILEGLAQYVLNRKK